MVAAPDHYSVKRRESLNLAHVLEDSRPSTIPIPIVEKRIHTRFDKAFLVVIGSEIYGDSFAVARNVSAGGILVEMTYAPPLGTVVTVHFQHVRDDDQLDEIVARAEVKHHHYLNFTGGNDAASARAIGLRFVEFVDPDERIAPDRLH
jgi:PilZ domain-containing protein